MTFAIGGTEYSVAFTINDKTFASTSDKGKVEMSRKKRTPPWQ